MAKLDTWAWELIKKKNKKTDRINLDVGLMISCCLWVDYMDIKLCINRFPIINHGNEHFIIVIIQG